MDLVEHRHRDAKLLLTIPAAADRLSISRTQMYDTVLQPRGPIPVIRLGRCARVRLADLEAWAAEQAAAAREAADGSSR